MLALLHRLAPGAVMEKASIDEVYLDVTDMVDRELQVGCVGAGSCVWGGGGRWAAGGGAAAVVSREVQVAAAAGSGTGEVGMLQRCVGMAGLMGAGRGRWGPRSQAGLMGGQVPCGGWQLLEQRLGQQGQACRRTQHSHLRSAARPPGLAPALLYLGAEPPRSALPCLQAQSGAGASSSGVDAFAWGSVVVGGPLDVASEFERRLAAGAGIACRLRGALLREMGERLEAGARRCAACAANGTGPIALLEVAGMFRCCGLTPACLPPCPPAMQATHVSLPPAIRPRRTALQHPLGGWSQA